MGLLKLLSVNQTFTGVKSDSSPYHVTQQNWLPRFGMAEIPELAPAPKQSMKTEFQTPAPVSAQSSAAEYPVADAASRPLKGRWLSSHYPQKANRPLRQTELCLETVKVIRNDLRDSDIEVVPQPSRRSARSAQSNDATPDLFAQAAPLKREENIFAGNTKKSETAIFHSHASTSVLNQADKTGECASPVTTAKHFKSSGYLGLSMLNRWFGLGRRQV